MHGSEINESFLIGQPKWMRKKKTSGEKHSNSQRQLLVAFDQTRVQ